MKAEQAWTEHRAKLDDIEAQIAASPGYLAKSRWDGIARAYRVWMRNAGALQDLLDRCNTDSDLVIEIIQNVRANLAREFLKADVDLFLQGMLSSTTALIDQMRRFLQSYEGTEFKQEFERRNSEVAAEPEGKFFRALRNYLLHYGQAPIVLSAELMPTPSLQVRFDAEQLMQWSGWNADNRTFIGGQEKGLSLGPLVTTYKSLMTELFDWTFEQFGMIHEDEVTETNDLIRQMNLILSGDRASEPQEFHDQVAEIFGNHPSIETGGINEGS